MTSCVGAFVLVIIQVSGWTLIDNPVELTVMILHF